MNVLLRDKQNVQILIGFGRIDSMALVGWLVYAYDKRRNDQSLNWIDRRCRCICYWSTY